MIITFENSTWPKHRLGVVVDNITKRCGSAAPSIAYLKGLSLKEVLEWGLNRAESIHIKHTEPTPVLSDSVQRKCADGAECRFPLSCSISGAVTCLHAIKLQSLD